MTQNEQYRALSPDKIAPERYAQYVGKDTGDSGRAEPMLAGTPFESNVSPMNHYKMSRAQQIMHSNEYPSGSKDSSSVMKQIRQTELQPFTDTTPLLPHGNVIDWQLVPAPVEDASASNDDLNDKDLILQKYKTAVAHKPPKVDLFF